jgi:hypothetical protein
MDLLRTIRSLVDVAVHRWNMANKAPVQAPKLVVTPTVPEVKIMPTHIPADKLIQLREKYKRIKLSEEEVQARRHRTINRLAGQKWLDAGAPDGRADEFWFAAEKEYDDKHRQFFDPSAEPLLPMCGES